MIGHRTRFRENGDLPLWRGSTVKKKPPFFNARARSRVTLGAVEMRNTILGNDLNLKQQIRNYCLVQKALN